MALFSQKYIKKGGVKEDSEKFRISLGTYLSNIFSKEISLYNSCPSEKELLDSISERIGCEIKCKLNAKRNIQNFIEESPIYYVLDAITLAYRLLNDNRKLALVNFVNLRLEDENLCYIMSYSGEIDYNPDEHFNEEKQMAMLCLEGERYVEIKNRLISAYKELNPNSGALDKSIADMYWCLEKIVKFIVPCDENAKISVTQTFVKEKLRPIIISFFDKVKSHENSAEDIASSFGLMVKAMQTFRHANPNVINDSPSIGMATYFVSMGTVYLRLLVEIDKHLQAKCQI